jgi:DNA-binding NtrC family response regulator
MSTKASKHGSILLVDDDRHLSDSMSQWLRELGYSVDVAGTYDEAVQRINARPYDLALVDIRLGDRDGFDVLRYSRGKRPDQTVVLITGYGSADVGVEALRAGAFDLLTKPLIDDELEVAIDRAMSRQAVEQENRQLKAQLDYRYGVDNIIGTDHRMKRIFEMIDSISDTRATVLITGESGTGKSLIARAIHRRSTRSEGAFVEVACGALPETLLESELFGHVKGAFTGATSDKIGKFKQADGGTIFLDEIGTAPPSMQVKLLRVLQELEFEQVGGNKTFRVDTRAVLATNEDLSVSVREGRFRQDLFYRVNVINIEIPPLRDRVNDIPLLANHFLKQAAEEAGRPAREFTSEALGSLQRYNWPGNVRELQNVVSRAVLLGSGELVDAIDLPQTLTSSTSVSLGPATGKTLKEALEGPERQIIQEVLESNNWNRNATADALGINRTTLYKKMKRLGLEEPRGNGMPMMPQMGPMVGGGSLPPAPMSPLG